MWGGRRRRSAKKTRGKKMRGGVFYGAAVDPQIGTAGLARPAVGNDAADSATGRIISDSSELQATQLGGRRRRGKGKKTTRKGGRKSRRHSRRRTMRGGNVPGSVNSAPVGYGFSDPSLVTTGPATATGYAANVGGAPANAAWVRVAS